MIPFNKPYMTGKELWNIAQAHANGHLAGDGQFSKKCQQWLEAKTGTKKALLTHSCTAALEMAAILADIKPGDEVIMPSYTFVSTANSFVLRGATPVFVDIRNDTLNLDETKIEDAITAKTKVIVPVHYAGVGCEMDTIMEIASQHSLLVVEDAAQGIMSTYKGRPLGSIGSLGTLSFHETKNVISGEGGGLLINDGALVERSEIIREKGTDRSQFFRGEVDKYTWQDVGSSFLPSELVAAFLWAQLEEADSITSARLESWCYYNDLLWDIASKGLIRLPIVPGDCQHNAHMYYVLLHSGTDRASLLSELKTDGVGAIFHYVPLHSSPAGEKFGRVSGTLPVTESVSSRLVRLPLWCGITPREQEKVVGELQRILCG
jgi:dTDP-4-amino-4,6-dideoxygalactose transaminase